MTRIAVKRNKDYNGPKTIVELFEAISNDAAKEKRRIPAETVYSVVTHLFSKGGLIGYLRKYKRAFIEGFGTFVMYKLKRKARKSVVGRKRKRERRPGVMPMEVYRQKQRETYNENHQRRISQCREELFKLRRKNAELIAKGWKPWTFRQYCSVIHETELITYKKIVIAIDAKKIEDMKNGIYENGDIVATQSDCLFVFHSYTDNGKCLICPATIGGSPDVRKWNTKWMDTVNVSDLKPHIDEELFFIQ